MQTSRRSNEQRREKSIRQVLSSALFFFVSRGYDNSTLDDIAARANLTKGAVYFYFKNKLTLLHALLDEAEALYTDIFQELEVGALEPEDQLENFIDWCADTGARHQDRLVLPILISLQAIGKEVSVVEHIQRMYGRYHGAMARIITEGKEKGVFDQQLAVRERAAVLVALTDGMLLEWYRFSDQLNGAKLASNAKHQIFYGLSVGSRRTATGTAS